MSYLIILMVQQNYFQIYTVRKFVLNLTFHVTQTVHSNYYVNLTQAEYVRK